MRKKTLKGSLRVSRYADFRSGASSAGAACCWRAEET